MIPAIMQACKTRVFTKSRLSEKAPCGLFLFSLLYAEQTILFLFLRLFAILFSKKNGPRLLEVLRAIDGARTRGLDLGKVARYQLRHYRIRAGDGNRTHVSSLEGWCSTIELHPHIAVSFVVSVLFATTI